jgi:hypothetical protein
MGPGTSDQIIAVDMVFIKVLVLVTHLKRDQRWRVPAIPGRVEANEKDHEVSSGLRTPTRSE